MCVCGEGIPGVKSGVVLCCSGAPTLDAALSEWGPGVLNHNPIVLESVASFPILLLTPPLVQLYAVETV